MRQVLTLTLCTAMLAGCGGGSSSVDEVNSFVSQSNSSSSCSGRYADKVTASTRSAAKNDSQCGYYVAYADSYLEATKAACAQGKMSEADAYYESTYTKAASYANTTVAAVCGSSSSSGSSSNTSNTSSNTGNNAYYTLFVKRSSTSGTIIGGVCTGGSQPSDGTGYYYTAAGSYSSMSACTSAGSSYGLSFG